MKNFIMEIKIVKPHPSYPGGEYKVTRARGNYLIRTGHAVEVQKKKDSKKKETKAKSKTEK